VLQRAEKEISFMEKNGIACYFLSAPGYPARLLECEDAPLLIYFKGKCDLNSARIISIVGTRNSTDYGRSMTEKLVGELAAFFPDLLIVSGLAYGIDIAAHQSALKHQLPTVAILAHGLDRIYPPAHRSIALKMAEHGGLLTYFPSETQPDRPNFVRRNRIIAGLSDAVIIAESADRGGSLITVEYASSYARDVFAFPGRATDMYSQGCNRIIRQNKAALITCAEDLIAGMCWLVPDTPENTAADHQMELYFSEDEDSDPILAVLKKEKELHINQLSVKLGIPVHKLSGSLVALEMEGKIKILPGNMYQLR
jgi:DNA processing protein